MTRVRTAFFAGRECPCRGSAQRSGGVSNPPLLRPLPSRGRPGGLLTPPRAICICQLHRSALASAKRPAIAPAKSSPFRRARRLESKRIHMSVSASKGGPMPLIKARTRGKQLVRHITRLRPRDERNALRVRALPGRADRVRPESARRHRARQRQGVHGVASRASRVVRHAANAASAAVCAAHVRQQNRSGVSARSGWRGQQ